MSNKYLFLLISAFLLVTMSSAKADTWVDEDGGAIVSIEGGVVSVHNLNSFYYFDQLLTNIRKQKVKIRLCMGISETKKTGMPTDCFTYLPADYSFHNKGQNRAIHVEVSTHPFLLEAFESYLKSGKTMKVSLDDGDLFAAYTLNQAYALTPDSEKILSLPD
jgi:hypothetical protein